MGVSYTTLSTKINLPKASPLCKGVGGQFQPQFKFHRPTCLHTFLYCTRYTCYLLLWPVSQINFLLLLYHFTKVRLCFATIKIDARNIVCKELSALADVYVLKEKDMQKSSSYAVYRSTWNERAKKILDVCSKIILSRAHMRDSIITQESSPFSIHSYASAT